MISDTAIICDSRLVIGDSLVNVEWRFLDSILNKSTIWHEELEDVQDGDLRAVPSREGHGMHERAARVRGQIDRAQNPFEVDDRHGRLRGAGSLLALTKQREPGVG
jgi:hypothetical protein